MKHKCLSIAGFDPSGGAGLQADLKTFSAFGCYGMTVLTALTVQNTTGVKRCYSIPIKSIQEQLEFLFQDIIPDSIKIGMLFSKEVIQVVSDFLDQSAKNIPIVLDPVMVAKSGDSLLKPEATNVIKDLLIPQAEVTTPNLSESYVLTGNDLKKQRSVISNEEIENVALELIKMGSKAVLIKGGHLKTKDTEEQSNDFYLDQKGNQIWFKEKRIDSKNTHGTGCTLSSAIAAGLALKRDVIDSVKQAKRYITKAIEASKKNSVGLGHGPVHHFYHLWPTKKKMTI